MREEDKKTDPPKKPVPAKKLQAVVKDIEAQRRKAALETHEALEASDRYKQIVESMRKVVLHLPQKEPDTWTLLLDNIKSYSAASEFSQQISQLKSEVNQKTHALLEQELSAKEKEERIQELQLSLRALEEKQSLSHLLTRVGIPAQDKLLSSPEFRALFEKEAPHPSYVLSIDIRRSTELMLKARNPRLYAEFITILARQLREVILQNYGVFDKFTGDGILAFFPDFYSGKDAGYYVLKAANDCHRIFESHYRDNKHCFTSILKDIGLGIGIDYGEVQIVQIGGDFTVVGTPVVYACRMGGADAGRTYLNQPAFEKLFESYSAICDFDEFEINIKHEGQTLAYGVELNGKTYDSSAPDWINDSEIQSAPKNKIKHTEKGGLQEQPGE